MLLHPMHEIEWWRCADYAISLGNFLHTRYLFAVLLVRENEALEVSARDLHVFGHGPRAKSANALESYLAK